jgi:CBS domain-containing protein
MNDRLNEYLLPYEGTLLNALSKIEKNNCRAVFAVKADKVVGVISEGDIIRALLHGSSVYSPLSKWLNESFKYLTSKDYIKAWNLLKTYHTTLIPIVTDDFRLEDVITIADVYAQLELSSR